MLRDYGTSCLQQQTMANSPLSSGLKEACGGSGGVQQKIVVQPQHQQQLQLRPRPEGKTMFFSRHGESEFNVTDRIGGDSPLSQRGALYAKALARYFNTMGTYY